MKFYSSKLPVGLLTILLGGSLAFWVIGWPRKEVDHPESNHTSGHHLASEMPSERSGKSSKRSASDSRLNPLMQDELKSIGNLARKNPASAISRLDSLSDPELRSLALAEIAKGWAETDPHAAGAWVASLESENDSITAAQGLIPAWVSVSPDDCLTWASSLEMGNLREVSLAQIADAWVSVDPQRAVLSFFALKPEPGSETGLHVIVSQWALDAPEAAMNYFTQSSDSARREEFLETALVSLANKNPALIWNRAATGFSDPARILNVRAMALEAISRTNPSEAIQLAATIGNDPELLRGIARGWSYKDDAEVKKWISGITEPELAKSLMTEISPP